MTILNQRGRYGRYVGRLLTLSDFLIINAVYGVVVWLNPDAWLGHVRLVGLLINVAYLVPAWINLRSRDVRTRHMDQLFMEALRSVGLHMLVFFSLFYFLDVPTNEDSVFLELYCGMLVGLPLWWVVSRLALKAFRRSGRNFKRVVIVGTGHTARRLFEEMHADTGFGFRFLGFFDDEILPDFPYNDFYRGRLDQLSDFVRERQVDEIYFTLSGENETAVRTALHAADDNLAQFYFVPQMSRYLSRSFHMLTIGAVPMLTVRANPLSTMFNRSMKRAFDVIFSGLFLVVSPLVFIPVAIAIKLSSPGPVFFRQKRTGYMGNEFLCWKFRTMCVNPDSDSRQACKDDPRTTAVGNFLRRTSIDELPQFINVFLGEMSVVGPRPHMLAHTEHYSKLIDKYMVRHMVKPGITGWAQVNGYRGQTEQLWQMERRVEFDVWYIENWTFLNDLKIISRTIVNVLNGEDNAF